MKSGILICIILLSGCSVPLFLPTENDITLAAKNGYNTDLESLKKGYHLYVGKCGGCHYLYKPTQFPEEKWREKMPLMSKKAKVSVEEQELILNYLLASRYKNN